MASQGTITPGARARAGVAPASAWTVPDARRWLQLGLAAIWLLDGVLQYQPVMFTRAFSRMLAEGAAGNPSVIAEPITWAAGIVGQHPAATNAAFAAIQVALGLGIAWRRSVRVALIASIAWSVAVWWFGEGLGGVLTGNASPLADAPGPVILYALLAVLLWPPGDDGPAPFAAARPLGTPARPRGVAVARAAWLVLWGSLAYFAVLPANRAPGGPHDMIAGMAAGQPGWLASLDRGAASLLAGQGLAVSIVLAAVFAAIAAGVFLPPAEVRVTLTAAIVVALAIWVVGQNLGGMLAAGATDVGSGPLLVLIALAYWPLRGAGAAGAAAGASAAAGSSAEGGAAAGLAGGAGAGVPADAGAGAAGSPASGGEPA